MVTETTHYKNAVLLLAFGGPENLDEVEPFLAALMNTKQVSARQIEAVKEKYKLIGGGSPLKAITKRQAQALESELNKQTPLYRVFVGMKYTEPLIERAVEQILSLEIPNLIALPLTPYYNSASTGKYIQSLNKAITGKVLNVRIIKSYNTNPFLIKGFVKSIKDSISVIDKQFFIFSAHSLPVEMAKLDGYVEQLEQTLNLILKDVNIANYTLAFQSRGITGGEWLGPDVKDVLNMCAKQGNKDVVVVPLGFVSDHVETLYDIDIVYKQYALSLGLNFFRTPSLNTSEHFIQALKEEVVHS
ncbi:MAG: ferrochelatase [bacterium]